MLDIALPGRLRSLIESRQPSLVHAGFSIDLTDPDDDGRFSLPELTRALNGGVELLRTTQ